MRIRAATDGGAVRVELLNDVGASFAVAMFRPDFDGEDVVDQLEFLAASARECLALSRPPTQAAP